MIQQQNIIDVFHIVKTLRNNKSNMVETLVSVSRTFFHSLGAGPNSPDLEKIASESKNTQQQGA